MPDIDLKDLTPADLDRIVEIDRTERIEAQYVQSGGTITLRSIAPFIGGWPDLPETIEFCREHMRSGAEAIGAFCGDRLVGIVMVTPDIAPAMAQLSFLHVTAGFRRQGIGARLLDEAMKRARNNGHRSIYVTATPTQSAVGFYLSCGFSPTEEPIPRLFALEPEDIHLIARL